MFGLKVNLKQCGGLDLLLKVAIVST